MKSIFALAILFSFASCKKNDTIPPVISVISPSDNQLFTGGATATIKASITDNEGIHMIHLSVTDLSTAGHVIHFEEHFDGKSYDMSQTFAVLSGRSYKIELSAEDHDQNTTSRELTVSGN